MVSPIFKDFQEEALEWASFCRSSSLATCIKLNFISWGIFGNILFYINRVEQSCILSGPCFSIQLNYVALKSPAWLTNTCYLSFSCAKDPFMVVLCGWKQGHTHSTDYFLSLTPVFSLPVTQSVSKHLLDLCKRWKWIFNSLETESPAHLSVSWKPQRNQEPTLQHLSWAWPSLRSAEVCPGPCEEPSRPASSFFKDANTNKPGNSDFSWSGTKCAPDWGGSGKGADSCTRQTPWEPSTPSLVWRETSCQKHSLHLGFSWINYL